MPPDTRRNIVLCSVSLDSPVCIYVRMHTGQPVRQHHMNMQSLAATCYVKGVAYAIVCFVIIVAPAFCGGSAFCANSPEPLPFGVGAVLFPLIGMVLAKIRN